MQGAKRVFSIGDRIHIRYSGEQMKISIVARIRTFYLVLTVLWLLGWCGVGTISTITESADESEALCSLFILLAVALIAARSVLRMLSNEELITVDQSSISIDSQPRYLRFFQPPSRYSAAKISPFRIVHQAFAGRATYQWTNWQWSRGAIQFDYFERGRGTARFGSELESADARRLINLIVEHYPIYGMETVLRNTNASQ